jgi:hypothetical protein
MSSDGENIYYLFEYTDGTTTHSELYKYDTKNQKEEELKSFEDCYFYGGFSDTGALYTQKTADGSEDLHSYSFSGENTLIAHEKSLSNYFYFDEQKIVYEIYETEASQYCLYDSQTGQTEIICESAAELPIIYAVTDDKIYISTSDGSENSYGIGYLNKDDFASGNFDKVIAVE